jgi:hypothetical protein
MRTFSPFSQAMQVPCQHVGLRALEEEGFMPLAFMELHAFLQRVLLVLVLVLVPLTLFGYYVALQGDSEIPEPTDSVAFGS